MSLLRPKILVTGGTGYIGSHTVVELYQAGFDVVVLDSLENSYPQVLDGIEKIVEERPAFYKLNLRHKNEIEDFFSSVFGISGVIHFAASKAVGESVQHPLEYYENNLTSLIYLLQSMLKHKINKLVFSSSCTVYGQPDQLPVTEFSKTRRPFSPYGNTKKISEELIEDTCKATSLQTIALRYFNPIDAHPSALIGELPIGTPNNLVPFITQTAIGKRKQLTIFGNDYPTPDGTCIRDYIHVVDLAKAHVSALNRVLLRQNPTLYEVYNIGTGQGNSVLEVINAFEKESGRKLNYIIGDRREGDVTAIYADTQLAKTVLGWEAGLSLNDMLRSAWEWEKNISNIYGEKFNI